MDLNGSNEPRYTELDQMKLVGLKCEATMENKSAIPKLWDKFFSMQKEIRSRKSECCLGVCCDYGNESNMFSYFTGCIVKDYRSVPSGMLKMTLPRSKYAVFTHKGRLDGLEDTYDLIYHEWLPASGKKLSEDGRVLEIYDKRFTGEDNSEFDIYVPIES